jgi:acetyl-CoA carboxylase alpha subunit
MKEESLLWMMHHHLDSAITLMNMIVQQELLDLNVVEAYIEEIAKVTDTVWEEQVWRKYSEALYYNEENTGNVIQFRPESRGPDT